MEKISWIIPTTSKFFKSWFLNHWDTQREPLEYDSTPETHVYLSLQTPQIYPNTDAHSIISMKGISTYETKEKLVAQATYPWELIRFTIIQIDLQRIELQVMCFHDLVWNEILLPFLGMIKKTWEIDNVSSLQPERNGEEIISEKEQEILDYWNKLYTGDDIGKIVGLTGGTVLNIITDLRNKLGEEMVPFHSNRRKSH